MSINSVLSRLLHARRVGGNAASTVIREAITVRHPAMIGRFGANEIKATLWPQLPSFLRQASFSGIAKNMSVMAGFFPSTGESLRRFSNLMYEDMRLLDVLGSWRFEEALLRRQFPRAHLIGLRDLEPYYSEHPWTECLAGRDVLVVHPFNSSIERQYKDRRRQIFQDRRVLPEFKSLQTIKAVQTIAGQQSQFPDWFSALDHMKSEVDSKRFDIAIIGCGAYGFPLAAHIKRSGRTAVHLGGATQLLFGIKGKRWDSHPFVSKLYNEHWIRPAPEDTPVYAKQVEDACYW